MATNFTEVLVSEALTNKKGLNRFRWDMTHAGPWNNSESRRYRNGPMASPGQYTAVLITGGQEQRQAFELLVDPRVTESGVTEADINAQVDLQLRIRNKVTEILKLQQKIEEELKELEGSTSRSEAEETRLVLLKENLARVRTEEGIYMQPMLADQWMYLYYMMSQADQAPGRDALERFEELSGQLEALKQAVNL